MGDTGSLAIGAGLAGAGAGHRTPHLLLPIIGGLFVIETLSVIIQVGSFRLFDRRGVPHGADPPPLRARRLAGDHRHHPLLDPRRRSAPRWRLGLFYADFLSHRRPSTDGRRTGRPSALGARRRLGRRGEAVAASLARRGDVGRGRRRPADADDRRRALAARSASTLVEAPDAGRLRPCSSATSTSCCPSPGVPDAPPGVRRGRAPRACPCWQRVRPGRPLGRPPDRRRHRHRRQDDGHHAGRRAMLPGRRLARRRRRQQRAARSSTRSTTRRRRVRGRGVVVPPRSAPRRSAPASAPG